MPSSSARTFPTIVENEGRAAGPPKFGTLLRSFRLTVGLSQEALAERAGMSAHGIRALERGYRRTPQRGTLALLSGALALSDEQQQELEVAAARWVLLRDGGRASVTVGPWPDTPTSKPPAIADELYWARTGAWRDRSAGSRTSASHADGHRRGWQDADRVAGLYRSERCECRLFVGLAPMRDPSLVMAAIAAALACRAGQPPAP